MICNLKISLKIYLLEVSKIVQASEKSFNVSEADIWPSIFEILIYFFRHMRVLENWHSWSLWD